LEGNEMKNAASKNTVVLAILGLVTAFASIVYSHCQIPCGIYDDSVRFDMLAEHITTIEKSMKQITELSQVEKPNFNQVPLG